MEQGGQWATELLCLGSLQLWSSSWSLVMLATVLNQDSQRIHLKAHALLSEFSLCSLPRWLFFFFLGQWINHYFRYKTRRTHPVLGGQAAKWPCSRNLSQLFIVLFRSVNQKAWSASSPLFRFYSVHTFFRQFAAVDIFLPLKFVNVLATEIIHVKGFNL